MKKCIFLFFSVLVFYSCLNNDEPRYRFEYLTIKSAQTPESFTFGETDTIKIKYLLPNNCYSFDRLYYDYQDTTRVVAVVSLFDLEGNCNEVVREEEHSFFVKAIQREDYVFKFWKGKDSIGNNMYEEVVIPVN